MQPNPPYYSLRCLRLSTLVGARRAMTRREALKEYIDEVIKTRRSKHTRSW